MAKLYGDPAKREGGRGHESRVRLYGVDGVRGGDYGALAGKVRSEEWGVMRCGQSFELGQGSGQQSW